MRKRPWYYLDRIRATENGRLAVAGIAMTGTVGIILILLANNDLARMIAAFTVLIVGALLTYWVLNPTPDYCYVIADTTDLQNNASP